MRVVDVHNHYVPSALVEDARKGAAIDGLEIAVVDGAEWLVHRQGFRYPLPVAFHDMEARLASMDDLAVEHAVVSIAPTLFLYWADPTETIDFCRAANDSLARFAAASGGRVTAVATLPMQAPDAAVKELHRAVGELDLVGAEIGPAVEGTPLDHPAMRPVLNAASELRVPLILHPYYVGPRQGLSDFYLVNLIGNPLETTVCAARLILSGTLDELERLELVLMHGGGYLPYQIGRLDHGHLVRPEARACRRPPSAYLDRFAYDTLTHAPRPLEFLVDLVGAERVVFGTDFPFDMGGGSFDQQLAGVGLDPGQREQVAWRTAARLFRLPPAGQR
ncbi:MAG TPA: amidohydrolase family protein [Actinomycetota bacterium]|jgi:aminocarboxymuconate-semialdehyde decarboxylase|nr:amidohydrolase family protein [Actinomycetota bacterium]